MNYVKIVTKRVTFIGKIFEHLPVVTSIKIVTLHFLFALGVIKKPRKSIRVSIGAASLDLPVDRFSLRTFLDTFVFRYHLPSNLSEDAKVILDFGSNIGLTCFDYSLRYPNALVQGYEIDLGNVVVARKINRNNSRVTIYHLGVSDQKGTMYYNSELDSDAFSLINNSLGISNLKSVSTESISQIFSAYELIDLVKVDIEGTELATLKSLGKQDVKNVREMVVEVHNADEMVQITDLLTSLGFKVKKHERHWSALRALRD
jgi:FkbM family methyltransferase